jgi:hypothetical protein
MKGTTAGRSLGQVSFAGFRHQTKSVLYFKRQYGKGFSVKHIVLTNLESATVMKRTPTCKGKNQMPLQEFHFHVVMFSVQNIQHIRTSERVFQQSHY